ncbi:hypothetical protein FOZ61_000350, partial [Perkinsus olseni]
ISRPDGEFTAFEACFGAPPNRLVEAIGDYHREDGQATLEEDPIDDDFINKIRYNIRESLGSIHAHADARAHYSLTGRVADQQRSRGLSHNFTAGQQVLVKGRDLEVPLSIIKIYSDDNGDSRVLVLEDGSRVPTKDCFHPPVKRHYFCRAGGLTHVVPSPDEFVVFTREDSAGSGHADSTETVDYFVAKVISVGNADDKITLHHYGSGGRKIIRFLPIWTTGSATTRRGEAKPGEEALTEDIFPKQILCILPLKNGCLTEECKALLRRLGVSLFEDPIA